MITPHNYLPWDASRQTRQQIRIDHPGGNDTITAVQTFGVQAPGGTIDLAALAPDYYAYSGDEAVRKFPYDPQHPYNDSALPHLLLSNPS